MTNAKKVVEHKAKKIKLSTPVKAEHPAVGLVKAIKGADTQPEIPISNFDAAELEIEMIKEEVKARAVGRPIKWTPEVTALEGKLLLAWLKLRTRNYSFTLFAESRGYDVNRFCEWDKNEEFKEFSGLYKRCVQVARYNLEQIAMTADKDQANAAKTALFILNAKHGYSEKSETSLTIGLPQNEDAIKRAHERRAREAALLEEGSKK